MESGIGDFLLKLSLGSGMVILNLGIQVLALRMIRGYFKRQGYQSSDYRMPMEAVLSWRHTKSLAVILLFLFLGHLFQFATWAGLFVWLGEFSDFGTAFYHSTVNFTSLGYGDIVMSEEWRLLGALEAANGVLMFGITAGLVLAVMTANLQRNQAQSRQPGSTEGD
ncbi:MAG: potassium channel family protein [Xanthomonadales bacterium]|nr:potassium channel family protein [Xanthomonadales bacterium]